MDELQVLTKRLLLFRPLVFYVDLQARLRTVKMPRQPMKSDDPRGSDTVQITVHTSFSSSVHSELCYQSFTTYLSEKVLSSISN